MEEMVCQGPPDLLVMNILLFTSIESSPLWFIFVCLGVHAFVCIDATLNSGDKGDGNAARVELSIH